MNIEYKQKYLKYKQKYIDLKYLEGGSLDRSIKLITILDLTRFAELPHTIFYLQLSKFNKDFSFDAKLIIINTFNDNRIRYALDQDLVLGRVYPEFRREITPENFNEFENGGQVTYNIVDKRRTLQFRITITYRYIKLESVIRDFEEYKQFNMYNWEMTIDIDNKPTNDNLAKYFNLLTNNISYVTNRERRREITRLPPRPPTGGSPANRILRRGDLGRYIVVVPIKEFNTNNGKVQTNFTLELTFKNILANANIEAKVVVDNMFMEEPEEPKKPDVPFKVKTAAAVAPGEQRGGGPGHSPKKEGPGLINPHPHDELDKYRIKQTISLISSFSPINVPSYPGINDGKSIAYWRDTGYDLDYTIDDHFNRHIVFTTEIHSTYTIKVKITCKNIETARRGIFVHNDWNFVPILIHGDQDEQLIKYFTKLRTKYISYNPASLQASTGIPP